MTGYRDEIDGLRAIAVLSVMVAHTGSGLLSGGFLGVDIFFTISGYLITGIILRGLEGGEFQISHFLYPSRKANLARALCNACPDYCYGLAISAAQRACRILDKLPSDPILYCQLSLYGNNRLFCSQRRLHATAAHMESGSRRTILPVLSYIRARVC